MERLSRNKFPEALITKLENEEGKRFYRRNPLMTLTRLPPKDNDHGIYAVEDNDKEARLG